MPADVLDATPALQARALALQADGLRGAAADLGRGARGLEDFKALGSSAASCRLQLAAAALLHEPTLAGPQPGWEVAHPRPELPAL